jgi:hypothetical protein
MNDDYDDNNVMMAITMTRMMVMMMTMIMIMRMTLQSYGFVNNY